MKGNILLANMVQLLKVWGTSLNSISEALRRVFETTLSTSRLWSGGLVSEQSGAVH